MSIRYDVDGAVVVVTIDRPEVANAIDRETARALADAFRRFDADDALAVAVLTGSNGKFCASRENGLERNWRSRCKPEPIKWR